ncbi:MAG: DUF4190 domain-containing protein [Planctomycetota bacterium]
MNHAEPIAATTFGCAQHPSVETDRCCAVCAQHMCELCTFTTPGGAMVCPTCVRPSGESPDKQRTPWLAIGSIASPFIGFAGLMALGVVAAFLPEDLPEDSPEAMLLGLGFIVSGLGGGVAGVSLGVASLASRRRGKALAITGTVLGSLMVLLLAGMFVLAFVAPA